jgi:hypothetical protein
MTPAQRRRRARIAAHASWAKTADRVARTAPGTRGLLARFERQVDPDGLLCPQVRLSMAHHARTAYMLQLAERSAAARRRSVRAGGNAGERDRATGDRTAGGEGRGS